MRPIEQKLSGGCAEFAPAERGCSAYKEGLRQPRFGVSVRWDARFFLTYRAGKTAQLIHCTLPLGMLYLKHGIGSVSSDLIYHCLQVFKVIICRSGGI